jgi:hypothetical protein
VIRSTAALFGLAIALAACTPMQWEHPHLGVAGVNEAMEDCSRSARQEALRLAYSDPFYMAPRMYRGRDGRLYYDPFPSYRRDPYLYEGQLQDYCMRNKGYRLVPVPQQ